MPPSDLLRLQENLARVNADTDRRDEAKQLLEQALTAIEAHDQVAADAALAAALAMPPIDLGTQDCAGLAARYLVCDEIDRQAQLDWDDDLDAESLDGLVGRAVAVIDAFSDQDDRDVRAAFAYLTDMNVSDAGDARLRALTDDVRNHSPLSGADGDEQRKQAVLRLLRARDLLRASGPD